MSDLVVVNHHPNTIVALRAVREVPLDRVATATPGRAADARHSQFGVTPPRVNRHSERVGDSSAYRLEGSRAGQRGMGHQPSVVVSAECGSIRLSECLRLGCGFPAIIET